MGYVCGISSFPFLFYCGLCCTVLCRVGRRAKDWSSGWNKKSKVAAEGALRPSPPSLAIPCPQLYLHLPLISYFFPFPEGEENKGRKAALHLFGRLV